MKSALRSSVCLCVFFVLAASLIALASNPAPSGPGEFVVAQQFALAYGPSSATIGDFNRDGKLDVAVTNADPRSSNVEILLGNGNGTFQSGTFIAVSPAATALASGDVNGDGNPDLVALQSNGSSVYLLLGNGNGTFQTPTSFVAGTSCVSVAIADVNSDGKQDIVAGCVFGTAVLLGNGNGTFGSAIVSNGSANGVIAVADVNNDGKMDALIPTGNQQLVVQVCLGAGNGTFGTPINTPFLPTPTIVRTGDFNNDGKVDLAVGNFTGGANVSILLGNGDGTFGAPHNFTSNADAVQFITVADLNGDSKVDVAIVSSLNHNADVLLGNGDGTLQTAQGWDVGQGPTFIGSGDFNGDHKTDLVVANSVGDEPLATGALSVLLNNSTKPTFQAGRNYLVGTGSCFNSCSTPAVASADLNRDGQADIVTANNQNNSVSVLLGNPDGTFKPKVDYPAGNNPTGVVIADFNRDGKLDIAVSDYCSVTSCGNADGGYSILLGNGDGTFLATTTTVLSGNPIWIASADINNDGKLDLVISQNNPFSPGEFSVLLGTGSGTFGSAITTTTIGAAPFQLATGDFNGDGKLDVALTVSNNIEVQLGNGNGTFSNGFLINIGAPTGINLADFNKDGKLDIAFTAGAGGSFADILLGNGDGTFKPLQSFPVDGAPNGITSADFNGDGRLDLAVAANNAMDVLISNGDGTFKPFVSYPSGGPGQAIASGDYHKDGALDIALTYGATGFTSNGINVIFNAGATTITLTSSLNPSTYGQGVTFTVTVKPAITVYARPNPTGKVTFKDGSTVLGQVNLTAGTATFTTSALTAGSHTITASYSGDNNYNVNNSRPVTQVVNQATTTTGLTSVPNPSSVGQTVTFTATVTPQVTGTATGTVNFFEGATQIGSGTLSGGVATFMTSTLTQGNHSITARYTGDTNFQGSTSTVLVQRVRP